MSDIRRRFTIVALGIVALLALCACNAGSQIKVQPDGSGTFSTVLTVPGSAGESLYQSVLKAEASNAVALTVTRYSANGESGAKISAPFRSLNDLTALSTKLGSSTGLAGVSVTKAASGWTFGASSDGGLVRPPGAATGAPGGAIDGSKLAGLVTMSVSVELPGAPGRTNADTVTHTGTTSTFGWHLAAGRSATDLSARTTFVGNQRSITLATAITPPKSGGAGSATVAATTAKPAAAGLGGTGIAGIAAAVVLLAGGAVLLLRRSRRTPAA